MKKFKGKEIELFGEKLFLHERVMIDAYKLNEFWKDPDVSKEAIYAGALSKIEALKDALKFNIEDCEEGSERHKKLTGIISTDYLYKNLGVGTMNELIETVLYDLEGNDRNAKGEEKDSMSLDRMISLVSQFTGISWDEAKQLPVSEFTSRLDNAVNIASLLGGGKFGMKSAKDKQSDLEKEYDLVKEFWDEQETIN